MGPVLAARSFPASDVPFVFLCNKVGSDVLKRKYLQCRLLIQQVLLWKNLFQNRPFPCRAVSSTFIFLFVLSGPVLRAGLVPRRLLLTAHLQLPWLQPSARAADRNTGRWLSWVPQPFPRRFRGSCQGLLLQTRKYEEALSFPRRCSKRGITVLKCPSELSVLDVW